MPDLAHQLFIFWLLYWLNIVLGTSGFLGGSHGKESACNARGLDQEDPPEKGMSTHSSILAWRIPWTEEPGSL